MTRLIFTTRAHYVTDTDFLLTSANYRFVKQPTHQPLSGRWYEEQLDLEMP
jgi:hypothetical protein